MQPEVGSNSDRATEHVAMASLSLPRGETDRLLTDSSDTLPSPFAVPAEARPFAGSSTRQAKAAIRSAAPWRQTVGASGGSPPTAASSSARALLAGRPSSPAAAAGWSATSSQSGSAAPAAATGSPGCRRSRSATAEPHSTGTGGSSARVIFTACFPSLDQFSKPESLVELTHPGPSRRM